MSAVATAIAPPVSTVKVFEQWAQDYYEPAAERHYDLALARMVRLLNPPEGSTVLDAGCGTGVHSIRVAQAGYRVQAVDLSAVAVEEARRRAAAKGLARMIDVQEGDVTRLPFPNESFHSAFSWGVIIHVPNVEDALQELVRVLKPGGRLAVEISNLAAFDRRLESVARLLLRKPIIGEVHGPLGVGSWSKMNGDSIWTWWMHIPGLLRAMDDLGCTCIHRGAAEATELQRRLKGPLRTIMRKVNDAWFSLRLPAAPACTNLLVFEKQATPTRST